MTAPAAPAPERAALWEDFLEIFIKPADVFERRKAAGFAVPLLILTVLFAVLWFGLKGAFQPLMDAENARAIAKVMAKNPQQLADYRGGKDKLFGFFVGQVRKATQGKANPAQLNELLKRKLGG